jgi:hypothetical protein
MNTNLIVESLTEKRDRVLAAIAALTGGRTHRVSSAPRKRPKRSAAIRKKLSLAAKARWAQAKKDEMRRATGTRLLLSVA